MEEKKAGRPKKRVEPNIILKGKQRFRHDLFKAEVETMLKNVSYKKGVVDIKKVEHCHFFHTFNSQGKRQTYTNAVGGHFHKIEWKVDDSGSLVAECGPAIKFVNRRTPMGLKKDPNPHPVQWMDEMEGKLVVDEHKHDMTYIYSEELSPETVRHVQNVTQSKLEMARELGMESGFEG